MIDPAGSAVLERLPGAGAPGVPELDADPAWRLAAAFLIGHRGRTRRAYFNDIRAWYGWVRRGRYPSPRSAASSRRPLDR